MEPQLYNRLLVRLLALPIAALAALALILGYGFQRVEQGARAVDHSDQVIAHANRLIKLMVDEETGLRGFLLTHNPLFLEPLHTADQQIAPEFKTLYDLTGPRADQLHRLQELQQAHQRWEEDAYNQVKYPPSPWELDAVMIGRKRSMDAIRGNVDGFIRTEESLRDSRSITSLQINRLARFGLFAAAALVAILLVLETRRIFHRLTALYTGQIQEIRTRSEESYAREQWLHTTLRSIGDAVIACDVEGSVVFMNLVAEQLTGWREAEAKGKSLHDVFPIFNEDTRAIVENPVDKVRRLGTIVGLANHTFLVSRDGSEICIDDSGAPICNSSGVMIGIVLVFRDITERRVSEGALMRAEKLAAAGRLAASVAHEVNNPLEGLTNLVYIARRSDELDEIRSLLAQAENELGRIAHITRQSLGFYRETTTPAHFQPATIVREVTDFYASRATNLGVTLVVNTTTEAEVMGTAGELRQILSNLLANSLDACRRGDTVRVDASSSFDPRLPSRTGVRITVADTGAGILPHHLKSIFEPFFTTKKETGTGLGLWVSRELVEKHGGSLRVRSSTAEERSGTVFSLFLPVEGGPSTAFLPEAVEQDGAAHLDEQPLA
ncbi:MAG: CHASE3 domain-containing protein [Acidobacteriota bacterium]|nr:CHASE3 domain-containing protein [Acidobacteriota bacterium]